MHVAVIQFDIVWEDKPANQAIIEDMLADAALPAGSFVLLPELADTGFSRDTDAIIDDQSLPWAQACAKAHGIWLQASWAERAASGKGLNTAAVINPAGVVLVRYHKVHPFSYGRDPESDHYESGDALAVTGVDGVSICPVVCYDLRFPELWRLGAAAGAEAFTIGANWPDARQHHWRALLLARAIENQAYVIACNRIGRDPQVSYAGGSMIIDPTGAVLAEAGNESCVLRAEVKRSVLDDWRNKFRALRDMRPSLLGTIDVRRSD
jgi:omega-amidase